jgi:tetratricopeptide (TPR) repeat protein
VWQALREELRPQGLEIVTVALDINVEQARQIIAHAEPTHVVLVDPSHRMDELFGVVNVPTGIWIDEAGVIVRPPEPAFPGKSNYGQLTSIPNLPPRIAEMLQEAGKIRTEPEKYVTALRASPYALEPDEVLRRSRGRPREEAEAAAHFELAERLHATGREDAAVHHFREAHRLQPDNWTYRRQAWSLADPTQGPTELYEGDWLSDVRKIGAENYYPPLDM